MGGFTSYADLQSEVNTVGKRLICPWMKNAITNPPVLATWYHLWPVGGIPASGQLYTGTTLDFTRTDSTTVGALWTGGNKSPDFKSILYSHATTSVGTPPTLMLVDQVGYYPLTQSTSQQNFTNTTAPNRYNTNGAGGLQVSLVGGGTGGAVGSNITTLTYVDQDGNTGATMPTTPAVGVTISATLPTIQLGAQVLTTISGPFLPLATGDSGVQQLTNVTFSGANTGLEAFVLVRPLALIPLPVALIYNERDFATYISSLERVYDGACLTWLAFFPTVTGCIFMGDLEVGWG